MLISRENEKKLIKKIPDDKLADFIFMHLRNMWTVDGLYYLFIEEKFGIKEATEIDRKVWEIMGKIEARKIKELLNIKRKDITSVMKALSYSGWSMDLEDKEIEIKENKGIIKNIKCRVQNTRISKGLSEFGCKPVRLSFLKAFVKVVATVLVRLSSLCTLLVAVDIPLFMPELKPLPAAFPCAAKLVAADLAAAIIPAVAIPTA